MYAPERRTPVPGQEQQGRNRSVSYTGLPPSPGQPYRSQPPSPSTTRPPPSPSTRDRPVSSYYDPISGETRASNRDGSVNGAPHQRSPMQARSSVDMQPMQYHPYMKGTGANHPPPDMPRHPTQSSPPYPNHAHPGLPPNIARPPPPTSYDHAHANGTHSHSASVESAAPPPPPPRASNPMSMMNLLSDSNAPPATPSAKPPTPTEPATTPRSSGRKPSRTSNASQHQPRLKKEHVEPPHSRVDKVAIPPLPVHAPARLHIPPQTGPPGLTVHDTEAAWTEIQALDLSDVEENIPEMMQPKQEWAIRSRKRTLELQVQEENKRKRRRHHLMSGYHVHFHEAYLAQKDAFVQEHEDSVTEEVRKNEIEEDKERKKDQQRKRRREKAIADEQAKREEALQSLAHIKDDEERGRVEKDIQRYDKKIRDTRSRLDGVTPTKEYRNESPQVPVMHRREREVAMDGGLMTSFYSHGSHGHPAEEATTPDFQAPGGRRGARSGAAARGGGGGGGGRARKSKEQKEAEKARAAGAQAFIDQGQELPLIAPKEEERLQGYAATRLTLPTREDSEPLSDMTPAATFEMMQPTSGLTGMARFESKGYQQIYEQIARELAKQVPKVVRIKNNSLDTKQSNARKTAQLAAKEARRWQLRTNKSTKDVAARAKRAMREMLGFWKRNERDEREGRKVAERAELDKAKRIEAEREASRQKRKLNFLISQTELYSHFIGKKVKTDEIERHGQEGGEGAPGAQAVAGGEDAEHGGPLRAKVTNFEDLDF
ncbi:putative DNA helicase ino80, partial [Teratosphaeriaceae sp. CCFEE 6253]